MIKQIIFITILIGFSFPAMAQKTLSKESWKQMMKPSMPASVCVESKVWLKCYSLTKEQCVQSVTLLSQKCLDELDPTLPAVFNSPKEAYPFNFKLGECVGNAYKAAYASKRKENCTADSK